MKTDLNTCNLSRNSSRSPHKPNRWMKHTEKSTGNPRRLAASDLLIWSDSDSIVYRNRRGFSRASDYATYRHLTSSVVRHKKKLLYIIEKIAHRPVHRLDAEAIVCLMMGLSQLDQPQRTDQHAVVNETVELLAYLSRDHLKGFVNANLRTYLRNFDKYRDAVDAQPLEVKTSHPGWMVDRWREQFGEENVRRICNANNTIPSVQIVINPMYSEKDIADDLTSQGFKLEKQTSGGYCITNPVGLFDTSYARKGAFLVQDFSAQQIAKIVEFFPKRHILDACAAPGGKLFHLEWKYGSTIESLTALERFPSRFNRLADNRVLFGSRAKLLLMDAAQPNLSETFDLILVDAPCSATGTIRKHPEVKWNRKLQDIKENQDRQLRILTGISSSVRAGGHIVYTTCSLEREENQEVAELFLERNSVAFESFQTPPRV